MITVTIKLAVDSEGSVSVWLDDDLVCDYHNSELPSYHYVLLTTLPVPDIQETSVVFEAPPRGNDATVIFK